MTTKKTEVITGLTLDDFMTNTNLSKPSKLVLQSDGVDTDQYLLVVGAQAKQVARARLTWGMETAELDDAIKDLPSGVDRAMRMMEGESAINNPFALELIVGWSFDSYKISKVAAMLSDNEGLAKSVIFHAFSREATLEKK